MTPFSWQGMLPWQLRWPGDSVEDVRMDRVAHRAQDVARDSRVTSREAQLVMGVPVHQRIPMLYFTLQIKIKIHKIAEVGSLVPEMPLPLQPPVTSRPRGSREDLVSGGMGAQTRGGPG